MTITKLVYECDPSTLADITEVEFAEALENEIMAHPRFRNATVEVEFKPALRGGLTSVAGDDLPDDPVREFGEIISECGRKAFDACCMA